MLLGVEIDEQVVYLIQDFLDTGIGPVNLVDDDDGCEVGLESFGEHVAGLR